MCTDVLPELCVCGKIPDLLELELKMFCELPCGCWELNPGTLEGQPVLVTAEPSVGIPGFSGSYQARMYISLFLGVYFIDRQCWCHSHLYVTVIPGEIPKTCHQLLHQKAGKETGGFTQ